jgi:hypothetical protein
MQESTARVPESQRSAQQVPVPPPQQVRVLVLEPESQLELELESMLPEPPQQTQLPSRLQKYLLPSLPKYRASYLPAL